MQYTQSNCYCPQTCKRDCDKKNERLNPSHSAQRRWPWVSTRGEDNKSLYLEIFPKNSSILVLETSWSYTLIFLGNRPSIFCKFQNMPVAEKKNHFWECAFFSERGTKASDLPVNIVSPQKPMLRKGNGALETVKPQSQQAQLLVSWSCSDSLSASQGLHFLRCKTTVDFWDHFQLWEIPRFCVPALRQKPRNQQPGTWNLFFNPFDISKYLCK